MQVTSCSLTSGNNLLRQQEPQARAGIKELECLALTPIPPTRDNSSSRSLQTLVRKFLHMQNAFSETVLVLLLMQIHVLLLNEYYNLTPHSVYESWELARLIDKKRSLAECNISEHPQKIVQDLVAGLDTKLNKRNSAKLLSLLKLNFWRHFLYYLIINLNLMFPVSLDRHW